MDLMIDSLNLMVHKEEVVSDTAVQEKEELSGQIIVLLASIANNLHSKIELRLDLCLYCL